MVVLFVGLVLLVVVVVVVVAVVVVAVVAVVVVVVEAVVVELAVVGFVVVRIVVVEMSGTVMIVEVEGFEGEEVRGSVETVEVVTFGGSNGSISSYLKATTAAKSRRRQARIIEMTVKYRKITTGYSSCNDLRMLVNSFRSRPP